LTSNNQVMTRVGLLITRERFIQLKWNRVWRGLIIWKQMVAFSLILLSLKPTVCVLMLSHRLPNAVQ